MLEDKLFDFVLDGWGIGGFFVLFFQLIEEDARPLIPIMYQVLEKNLGEPNAPRRYKDFNFAAFTSWALEWALQELGEDIVVN